MSYTARHPETLSAGLLILGLVGVVFRKKLAEWRTPPAQESMVTNTHRQFLESITTWSSIALIAAGLLLVVFEIAARPNA